VGRILRPAALSSMNPLRHDELADLNAYWSWTGRYVGYRISDDLFSFEGRQVGYFAEGDEVYGCDGSYMGEVRGRNRLISNLGKKAWTRRRLVPRSMRSSPSHRDVSAKEMLAGYEDFPIPEGI
jgi:hypothetical protein